MTDMPDIRTRIEQVLTDHHLLGWVDEAAPEESLTLLDHLSSTDTVDSGANEIHLIADELAAVLTDEGYTRTDAGVDGGDAAYLVGRLESVVALINSGNCHMAVAKLCADISALSVLAEGTDKKPEQLGERELFKLCKSAVAAALPEDEPDYVSNWVYRTIIETVLIHARRDTKTTGAIP